MPFVYLLFLRSGVMAIVSFSLAYSCTNRVHAGKVASADLFPFLVSMSVRTGLVGDSGGGDGRNRFWRHRVGYPARPWDLLWHCLPDGSQLSSDCSFPDSFKLAIPMVEPIRTRNESGLRRSLINQLVVFPSLDDTGPLRVGPSTRRAPAFCKASH